MDISFEHVTFINVEDAVRGHVSALASPIDSFLENHILGSTHYRIHVSGERVGFASIHGGNLITQFALDDRFKQDGQAIFRQIRHLEQVQAAFVPTCDEFFLSHALDDYRHLAKQAYFFTATRASPDASSRCAWQRTMTST